MGQDKTYTGTIVLGQSTPSYDLETEVDQTWDIAHISPEMVVQAAQQFTGTIEQIPPAFSAIKKGGKPAYKSARKGKPVALEPRTVHIHAFEIQKIALPEIHFKVSCSKGTYIRSLAHDLGKALQVGGHLKALRRTHIGQFDVQNALTPQAFINAMNQE